MTLKQPIAFLGCDNLEAARAFYSSILDLDIIADEGLTLVYQLDNAILRISQIPDFNPQQFTVLGWMVDDIESKVKELKMKRVEFLDYPQFEQDDLDIWNMGSVRIAWFLDPAGNNLSLTQQL